MSRERHGSRWRTLPTAATSDRACTADLFSSPPRPSSFLLPHSTTTDSLSHSRTTEVRDSRRLHFPCHESYDVDSVFLPVFTWPIGPSPSPSPSPCTTSSARTHSLAPSPFDRGLVSHLESTSSRRMTSEDLTLSAPTSVCAWIPSSGMTSYGFVSYQAELYYANRELDPTFFQLEIETQTKRQREREVTRIRRA